MKKLVVLTLLALALPAGAHALTSAEIQARIATLLSQISALQQQLQLLSAQNVQQPPTTTPLNTPASTSATVRCPALTRTLLIPFSGPAMNGPDVAELQTYLNSEGYFSMPFSSGTFDPPTEMAVQKWQAAHNIVSSGTAETTGYGAVGPRTRAFIALNCRAKQQAIQANSGGAPSSCPVAIRPTQNCATGWQAVVDAYGCTNSYKCVVSPQTTTSSPYCPVYQQPTCTQGTLLWRGNDASGCSLGYVCSTGASVTTAQPSITISASAVPRGSQFVVTWNFPNPPASAKVRLELHKSTETPVEGNNDRGLASNASELATAGSYVWTVPSGSACLADAGWVSCVDNGTYKIVAKLYTGGTCWGYCSADTSRTVFTTVQSQLFGVY